MATLQLSVLSIAYGLTSPYAKQTQVEAHFKHSRSVCGNIEITRNTIIVSRVSNEISGLSSYMGISFVLSS